MSRAGEAAAGSGGHRVGPLLDDLFRRQYGQLVARLTRDLGPGRLSLIEDVVQDALLRAVKLWPYEGTPDDPRAWLTVVARRLATDALRRERLHSLAEPLLVERTRQRAAATPGADDAVADDTLRMMFMCCHPSLSHASRIALTLKMVGGFGTSEIAAALLARESAVAQRLSRAKAQLREGGVRFEMPSGTELAPRRQAVLDVLYLMFNEGYRAHSGQDLVRTDLVREAVRLADLLCADALAPAAEAHALLALMLFLAARIPARTNDFGELLTLSQQDRKRWDRGAIQGGFHHFKQSIGGPHLTTFHVEAAIASCHAIAQTYDATDWRTILTHYDQLLRIGGGPVAALNRAVAVAKVEGAERALRELDALTGEPALRDYALLPATRAQLLWTIGDHSAAAEALRAALMLVASEPERAFMRDRLQQCEAGAPAPDF